MGLLDVFSTMEGQQALGLLAAAGPRADGAGFGQRLQEGLGAAENWKARQQAAKMQEMKAQQFEFEMRQAKQQQEAMQAQAQEQARIKSILPTLFRQQSTGAPALNIDSAMPSEMRTGLPSQPATAPSAGGFDVQKAIQLGIPVAQIKEMMAVTAGPEYSPEVRYDQAGKAFMTAKDGSMKYLNGVSARDKLEEVRLGDRVAFRSPYSTEMQGSMPIGQSADSRASNAVTMRGQNMTDARSRETLAQGKVPAGYRMNADGSMSAISGGPADIKNSAESIKKVGDAKDVLGLLDEADQLLPKATGGYFGSGVDAVLGAANVSTKGAQATAQLKTIQGALISKMPKMTGPQSDKDVQLYREMAGQVADSTLPTAQRQAASSMIRNLNEKYAGMQPGESKATDTKTVSLSDITATAAASGRTTAEVTAAIRAKGYKIGGQ